MLKRTFIHSRLSMLLNDYSSELASARSDAAKLQTLRAFVDTLTEQRYSPLPSDADIPLSLPKSFVIEKRSAAFADLCNGGGDQTLASLLDAEKLKAVEDFAVEMAHKFDELPLEIAHIIMGGS